MSYHERTSHAAKGKWRGILQNLGLPAEYLTGRHTGCPICRDGKDCFRFDDKEGRGTYICNRCGAGDGMKLAIEFTGEAFTEVAPRIDAMLGNIKADAPRPAMTEDDQRAALREVWLASKPAEPGDLVHAYLESRGLAERIYPAALRFAPKLRDGEGGIRPCMVAMVGVHGDRDGKGRQRYRSMHRTFLRPDGKAKAEMGAPRKLMPGTLPDGACVMLSDWPGYGSIGIAEGIETALAASAMHDLPVWAAISTGMMQRWEPPEGADEVVIFADNDAAFGGHAAAYALAHKLKTRPQWKHLAVSVQVPRLPGTDFADEWLARRQA